jgi:hypothetical protein
MTNLPEEQLTDGPLDALVERYRAELKRLRRRVPLVHGRELPVPPHGARPSAKLSQLRPFSLTLLVQSTQSILSCLPQAGRYWDWSPAQSFAAIGITAAPDNTRLAAFTSRNPQTSYASYHWWPRLDPPRRERGYRGLRRPTSSEPPHVVTPVASVAAALSDRAYRPTSCASRPACLRPDRSAGPRFASGR